MTISGSTAPYQDYGGTGPQLHFSHANGYPPQAYQPLLSRLSQNYAVKAMHLRPLWPGADPETLADWRPLAADLADFLQAQQNR